ncbi:MAG: nucleotidyltransferase domain-containing protein [Cyanobacteria bacterium J06581_3]
MTYSNVMTHPKLQEILEQLKCQLLELYGDRLSSLILFGSQAREEATADSDIDILIVLNEKIDVPSESKRISKLVAELCLEYEVLLSCLWTELQAWKTRQSPLLINARREGIAV